MTAVAEFSQGRLERMWRRAGRAVHVLATTRSRAVLPIYRAQRSPRWKLVSTTVLLGVLGFVAMVYGLLSAVMPLQMMLMMAAPLAVAALLIIWALPEAATIPEKSLSRVFFAFFVIILVWPNYISIVIPGLPWISLRRMFGAVTALLLLVSLSTSKDFRQRVWAVASVDKWAIRFLLGFLALVVVSAAINRPKTLFGTVLDYQIAWTTMFFVGAWFFSSTRRVQVWIATLLSITAGLIVISFFEHRAGQVLWANHIPSFLQVDQEFVEAVLTSHFRGGIYRVKTVFSNPLIYGELLTFVVPFILHYLMNSRKLWQIAFWGGMDLLIAIGALISSARLSLIGFIVSHALYIFLWAVRRWWTERPGLIGPALTLMYPALIAVAGVLLITVDAFRIKVLGGGAAQASNRARAEQFDMAVPAIAKSPLFGHGPGASGDVIGWHTPGGRVSVDNYYLTIGADYGATGIILFFGAILILIWALFRESIRTPGTRTPLTVALAALLGVFMIIRSVLSQTDNNSLFFIILGLSVALLYDARNGRKISI